MSEYTYIGNPVEVIAFVIKEVIPIRSNPIGPVTYRLLLEDGNTFDTDPGMTAREAPEVEGYLVIQSNGYTYLNPKHVFERKYHRA